MADEDRRWQVETETGAVAPRSASDVIGELTDMVATGDLGEYEPIPLGFVPMDQSSAAGSGPAS